MSDEMDQVIDRAAGFNEFKKDELLTANDLNRAFRSGLRFSRLCAAAPPAVGLFRPWWLEVDEAANEISLLGDRQAIKVTSLFASLRNGMPVSAPPQERLEVAPGQVVILTEQGLDLQRADTRYPERALPLAGLDRERNLNILAPVAALDATEELRCHDRAVVKAAATWRDTAARSVAHFAFAQTLDALTRGGGLPRQRMEMLSSAAEIVHERLQETSGDDDDYVKMLAVLRESVSVSHDKICAQLKDWADAFSNELLRNRFFDRAPWLQAEKMPAGRDTFGLERWRIDLVSSKTKRVELQSPERFPSFGKWSYGSSVRQFEPGGQFRGRDGKWIYRLHRCMSDDQLIVWTNSSNLSWRVA